MPTEKIKNHHFEKKNILACMVFKLHVYVRNIISFFYMYKPKAQSNSDIWNFLSQNCNFGLIDVLRKIRYLEVRRLYCFSVGMEKGEPYQ